MTLNNWKRKLKRLSRPLAAAPAAGTGGAVVAARAFALADGERSLLHDLFVAPYYGRAAGLDAFCSADEAFRHFLARGLADGLSPSPLFQPEVFVAAASRDMPPSAAPTIVRWLRHPERHRLVPTHRFDADFYRTICPVPAEEGPFLHFARFGVRQGLSPHALFDPAWYEQVRRDHADPDRLPSYLHFLVDGWRQGLAPVSPLTSVFVGDGGPAVTAVEALDPLWIAAAGWAKRIEPYALRTLVALFVPMTYPAGVAAAETGASPLAKLIDFLERGIEAGTAPGPFFHPALYRARAEAAGQPVPALENALVHFARQGIGARIVPTAGFDEAAYRRTHPDIGAAPIWGFAHFIEHGIYEGRRIDDRAVLTHESYGGIDLQARYCNWRSFWEAHGAAAGALAPSEPTAAAQRRVSQVLTSPLFGDIMRRAVSLEPAIGSVETIQEVLFLPRAKPRYRVERELRARFARAHYNSIVCVPWIRMGGADLVAAHLCKALLALYPGEPLLLLRVDQPHLERPDWLPEGIDIVAIADLVTSIPPREAELMMNTMFLGLAPRRIFNVNSRLCWTTWQRFGARLARTIRLYAYLFCWDQTPTGLRVGYPSDFYCDTAGFLDAVFTDTEYLRAELLRLYRPPNSLGGRLVPLFTPSRAAPAEPVLAEVGAGRAAARARPLVLWAGRFDRQKRFDLVVAIAARMPDVDFRCWGKAVLDAPADLSALPGNVLVHPPYHDTEDLPLAECDAWLFTSAWEGMPTILVELAFLGIAIVASAVGGVPELIDSDTGWPVERIDDVEAYVQAVRAALRDPGERVRRAQHLQQRALSRHTPAAYQERLGRALAREAVA